MVITLVGWIYIFILCYVFGLIILNIFQSLLQIEKGIFPFSIVSFVGLIGLSVFASFFSLFSPIGWLCNLLIIIADVIALITGYVRIPRRNHKRTDLASFLLLLLAVLLLLENSTHRPINPDTNLYHAQAIHWIEAFPAVPGLGNLHGRLAYNSVWFVTNALFSFSFLNYGSFHLPSSFIFLLFLIYCWSGFEKVMQGNINLVALLKIGFIPLAFLLIGADVSSPGTDLPVDLLLWLVVIIWLENCENKNPIYTSLVVIISFFAFTIKISAAPILLFPSMILAQSIYRGDKRMAFLILISGAIIVTPFILRNVILSGYLFYPVTSINIFNFDWKVPAPRVEEERNAILAFARFSHVGFDRVLAMPIRQWIPAWFVIQTGNRKILFILAIFSFLSLIFTRRSGREINSKRIAWVIMYIGVIFWLFTAPDFRFGYGFLVPVILLVVIPWGVIVLEKAVFARPWIKIGTVILMTTFILSTFYKSYDFQTIRERLILPTDYDQVPTEVCNLANGLVNCAKEYSACSYKAFPCIPNPRLWVQFRGETLRDGFKSLPESNN